MTANQLHAYRDSATEFCTHIDVLLLSYDALAEDIRSAGAAVAAGDIPTRCVHLNRALLLSGHLESWVSLLDDEPLQQTLGSFYQYVRSELLRLQIANDPSDYTNLSMRICEVRAAWQCKQAKESSRFAQPASQSHFSCSI